MESSKQTAHHLIHLGTLDPGGGRPRSINQSDSRSDQYDGCAGLSRRPYRRSIKEAKSQDERGESDPSAGTAPLSISRPDISSGKPFSPVDPFETMKALSRGQNAVPSDLGVIRHGWSWEIAG